MASDPTPKTIVILGGSYAGLGTAHRLLKRAGKLSKFRIIIVCPNTHLYWNLASVRAIVPGGIAEDKISQPIAPGFKHYPDSLVELRLGTASNVDVASKTVSVESASGSSEIKYDILVLATGSKTTGDVPLKQRESTQATLDALHDFQKRVEKATSITIAGAGATGVEVSGELGFEYGTTKKITLIGSGDRVLEGAQPSVSKAATKQLQAVHVDLKLSTKVKDFQKTSNGRTELSLSDGTKFITDLYLPTIGLTPNVSYLPSKLLNARGYVAVDEFLRVKGTTDVWAVGDVTDVQRAQYVNVEKQSVHVVKNIELALKGVAPLPYSVAGKEILAVPVGRKGGTGQIGTMKMPSFMVAMVKGKTLFTEKMPGVINGSGV